MEALDNNIRTYCLIDFGLSHTFKDQYGNHHSMETTSSIFGNKNFMSLNHQEGYNQSRRDDLESLFYNLLYLSEGQFPWVTSKILDGQLTRSALYYKRNYNQEKIFKSMPQRLLEVQKGESIMIASHNNKHIVTRDNLNNMESFRSNVRSFAAPNNNQVVEENQTPIYPILNKESKTVRINNTKGKNSNFSINNYDNLQIGTSQIDGLIIGTNTKPKSLFLKKRRDQTPKRKAPKKHDSFLQYIQNQEQELKQNLNLNISNQEVENEEKQLDHEDKLTEMDDQDFTEQSLDQNNINQATLIVQQIQEHSFWSRQMDLKLIKC
ncbi:UNKNOWN [Stylonychia lemnae]|uniref:Uncharacterized protein n=1 Tax=Stylonychia lemnae TaxID=5949 RepID=A0A078B640_STYLE|nr:UNKNOWN [Stylonychia lemnae]|eukprot:CDW89980.1 UNKNOWN [Stylonychia lemnae]